MENSIINFLKITKEKIAITLMFSLAAILILFSGFVFEEILGLEYGSTIANAIYSLANYLYFLIFLPLTFVDSDFTSPVIFQRAIILTLIWWYFLSCVLIFIREKRRKK